MNPDKTAIIKYSQEFVIPLSENHTRLIQFENQSHGSKIKNI